MPDGFASPSRIAASRCPTSRVAIWLIDQWRQIGLNVKHEVVESAAYYDQVLRPGNFEVAMDFQCGYIVEPDLDLYKFTLDRQEPVQLQPLH